MKKASEQAGKGSPKRAVFLPGRFRTFHHGHDGMVSYALEHFDHVIIGIGVDPERDKNKVMILDPATKKPVEKKNETYPFSFEQTKAQILARFGKHARRITIVPIYDQHHNVRWRDHVLEVLNANRARTGTVVGYISHNQWVHDCLEKRIQRLDADYPQRDRGRLEGKLIRDAIRRGDEKWKDHVPPEVVRVMERQGARQILTEVYEKARGKAPKRNGKP